MIRVLVGDEDCVEVVGDEADPREPRRRVLYAKAAVDEHARAAGFDDEPVALAAAAERREAHARLAPT